MTVIAYIALGSNLQDPILQLGRALQRIQSIEKTKIIQQSSVYETAPIGPQDQPNFMNQVVSVRTRLSAEFLLLALQVIEQEMGRVREYRFGPRVIDCDLLLYGDAMIHTETLVIPHPRMTERAFVLYPLAEIAPTLRLPSGECVQDLCEQCVSQRIAKLESVS